MCLYPTLLRNPKYRENKKNGGNIPIPPDERVLFVPIGCGKCAECCKEKANEWRVRLSEELSSNPDAWFVTLTFNEESLTQLDIITEKKEEEYRENTIATKATRLFLERWRKKYKRSCRHWLITELGHEGTERIHLHGIIFCEKEKIKELENIWANGWVYIGEFCNLRTINYIVKYVTKIDNEHKDFIGKILTSAGIGNKYINKGKQFNQYITGETKEYYRTKEGYKLGLPIYYRNHIYSEEEREKLWLEKLDKKETWVQGIRIDISTKEGINNYINVLEKAQKNNLKNGYGKPEKWGSDDYRKGFEYLNVKKS